MLPMASLRRIGITCRGLSRVPALRPISAPLHKRRTSAAEGRMPDNGPAAMAALPCCDRAYKALLRFQGLVPDNAD